MKTEIILCIFFTLVFVLFISIRVIYIIGLARDWNTELKIYLTKCSHLPHMMPRTINWYKKYYINAWKYWWRLDCWLIKHIIDDKLLIEEIHSQIQNKYNFN